MNAGMGEKGLWMNMVQSSWQAESLPIFISGFPSQVEELPQQQASRNIHVPDTVWDVIVGRG